MDKPLSFDIRVPLSWNALSQEQLRFLLRTVVAVQSAQGEGTSVASRTRAMVAAICLCRWNGIEVDGYAGDAFMLSVGKTLFECRAAAFAEAVGLMEWIGEIPKFPVRLDTVDGHSAADAQLSGVSFAKFLALDNLWQGYLATNSDDRLRDMAAILYDADDINPSKEELLGVFYWWASVKQLFSNLYPSFFRSSDVAESQPDYKSLQKGMDTQIRALTKGDITKESLVLASDCRRALTELDALAAEYDEIKRKYPDYAK